MHEQGRGGQEPKTGHHGPKASTMLVRLRDQGRGGDDRALSGTMEHSKANDHPVAGDTDRVEPEQRQDYAMSTLPDILRQRSPFRQGMANLVHQMRQTHAGAVVRLDPGLDHSRATQSRSGIHRPSGLSLFYSIAALWRRPPGATRA